MDETPQRLKDKIVVLTEENRTLRNQVHTLEAEIAKLEQEEFLLQGGNFS